MKHSESAGFSRSQFKADDQQATHLAVVAICLPWVSKGVMQLRHTHAHADKSVIRCAGEESGQNLLGKAQELPHPHSVQAGNADAATRELEPVTGERKTLAHTFLAKIVCPPGNFNQLLWSLVRLPACSGAHLKRCKEILREAQQNLSLKVRFSKNCTGGQPGSGFRWLHG